MFQFGCTHACNGCTDDTYNGHLIGKWKYKENEYIGMPQFESIDEWSNEINNIEIIDWVCPNNGLICKTPVYPIITHPEQYSSCDISAPHIENDLI